jgi:succinate-acetate transporter protein
MVRAFDTHIVSILLIVNGKIKQWISFSKAIQNARIPHVGDYLGIVCGLINAYQKTVSIDNVAQENPGAQRVILLGMQSKLKKRLESMEDG